MARPPLWHDKSVFEGFVNWLSLQLEIKGLTHEEFSAFCGFPSTRTWQGIRNLRGSWNDDQIEKILVGLGKLGIKMDLEQFWEKVAATSPQKTPTTAKALLQAWSEMEPTERWLAGISISQETLQYCRGIISDRPDVQILKEAVSRYGLGISAWAKRKELPIVRMNALFDGYNLRLSATEFGDFAGAVGVKKADDQLRRLLEDCLLMPDQTGSPQKFVDLVDFNCKELGFDQISQLAAYLAEKNSQSVEFFERSLEKLYLEREPIDLKQHNDFLWALSKTLVDFDGKSFGGKVANLAKACGFKDIR